MISGAKLLTQKLKGTLYQTKSVGPVHGAGYVNQEYQVLGPAVLPKNVLCLEPHLQQQGVRVPGTGGQFRRDAEGFTLSRFL